MFNYTNISQDDSAWIGNCIIDEDLSYFQGHFPKLPILPAVAQLEMLQRFVSHVSQSACALESASALKFIQPILPLDEVTLSVDMNGCDVKFTIYVGEKLCTRGKFVFRELA